MNTAKNPRNEAQAAYEMHVERIKTQLATLTQWLADHGAEVAKEGADWGYVGDVATVSDMLRDPVDTVSVES